MNGRVLRCRLESRGPSKLLCSERPLETSLYTIGKRSHLWVVTFPPQYKPHCQNIRVVVTSSQGQLDVWVVVNHTTGKLKSIRLSTRPRSVTLKLQVKGLLITILSKEQWVSVSYIMILTSTKRSGQTRPPPVFSTILIPVLSSPTPSSRSLDISTSSTSLHVCGSFWSGLPPVDNLFWSLNPLTLRSRPGFLSYFESEVRGRRDSTNLPLPSPLGVTSCSKDYTRTWNLTDLQMSFLWRNFGFPTRVVPPISCSWFDRVTLLHSCPLMCSSVRTTDPRYTGEPVLPKYSVQISVQSLPVVWLVKSHVRASYGD